jgi:hypothetical protein
MQSAYHNLPTINGADQAAGRQYAARKVRYEANDGAAELVMDIAPSYPRQACVTSWVRAVRLMRGQHVEVRDAFQLAAPATPIVQNLMTPRMTRLVRPGQLVLQAPRGRAEVSLAYEPASASVEVETIDLPEGDSLHRAWGSKLYRIRLAAPADAAKGERLLRFTMGPARGAE